VSILSYGKLQLPYSTHDLLKKFHRYLVVIDDLWDTISWDTIKCAFPENNLRSRFIVTTRIESVARICCTHQECLYRLKPLNDHDSRRLLFSRTFSPNRDCPSQFKEVSTEILKKCGGLPLAIITVASLLANLPTSEKEDWEKIKNSLGSHLSVSDRPHVVRDETNFKPQLQESSSSTQDMFPVSRYISRGLHNSKG